MRDRERRRDAASPPGVRECARRGIEASRISGDRQARKRRTAVGERRRPPRRIGFGRIRFLRGRGIQNADHGLLHHFKGSPAVNNRRTRRRGPQTSARSLSAHPRALVAGALGALASKATAAVRDPRPRRALESSEPRTRRPSQNRPDERRCPVRPSRLRPSSRALFPSRAAAAHVHGSR